MNEYIKLRMYIISYVIVHLGINNLEKTQGEQLDFKHYVFHTSSSLLAGSFLDHFLLLGDSYG